MASLKQRIKKRLHLRYYWRFRHLFRIVDGRWQWIMYEFDSRPMTEYIPFSAIFNKDTHEALTATCRTSVRMAGHDE